MVVIHFQDKTGKNLREPWSIPEVAGAVPTIGDQVLMEDGEICFVESRMFSFAESAGRKIQSAFLILSFEDQTD